jgi:hypothetical protein
MRFINYLNLHRSRLGYVNCVLLVADTQLDSAQSLRRRLDKLLFDNVVYQNSAAFAEFEGLIGDTALKEIGKRAARRGLRKSKQHRQGVVQGYAFESNSEDRGDSDRGLKEVYSPSELWLFQKAMRSHFGIVIREYSDAPIELAKDLGFLSEGYALTEFGNIAKLFLVDRIGDFQEPHATPNPLLIYEDVPIRLLYLYALLRDDIVFPYILESLSLGFNTHDVLKASLERLVGQLEDNTRLDEVSQFKGIVELRDRIVKEPVEKTQRVPRLEYCVDLGFLDRVDSANQLERMPGDSVAKGLDGAYRATSSIGRVSLALGELIQHPNQPDKWLDRQFFKAAGILYGWPLDSITNTEIKLLYFVRGADFLQRKMGFIPGRVASMIGCLFAWIDGFRLEVADLFQEVYLVPKGKWAGLIKFSGGSRLDSEFLVAIEEELLPKLREATGLHTIRRS